MASVSEYVDAVARELGCPIYQVEKPARALIVGGLLPKSRGRRIPKIEDVHKVRLIAALALNPKIKSCADTVSLFMEMAETSSGGEDTLENALCALGRILKKQDSAEVIGQTSIVFDMKAISASVTHPRLGRLTFGQVSAPLAMKQVAAISGAVFLRLFNSAGQANIPAAQRGGKPHHLTAGS